MAFLGPVKPKVKPVD